MIFLSRGGEPIFDAERDKAMRKKRLGRGRRVQLD
jgi:hypothetical protein